MTNMEMVKSFYEDITVNKEILWLDLAKKRGAAYDWLGNNPKPILGWFNQNMK